MALPVRALVEPPPLLANSTTLLKTPGDAEVKPMTRLVQPEPSRLNGVPDRIKKFPGETDAEPLSVAAPLLLTTMDASTVSPVEIRPKSRLDGVTTSCGGWITTT